MATIPFSIPNIILLCLIISMVESSIYEGSQYRWNLVPKKLLKRLCNLDDTLPICAWKRHVPLSGKPVYSKWQICRDHPELNLCKWHNGGMVTVSQPTTTTTTAGVENSAEAPPTSSKESIFENEPDMILSSKWSNRQIMTATLKKELNQLPSNRFDGQLRAAVLVADADSDAKNDENFDESIMTASESIFNV